MQDIVFMLFKEEPTEYTDYRSSSGTVTIFSVASLTPQSKGMYICRTHIQMYPTLWSEPSDPLKLIVAGGCSCWVLMTIVIEIKFGTTSVSGVESASSKNLYGL